MTSSTEARLARRTPHSYSPTGQHMHHAAPLCGPCGLPEGNKVHIDGLLAAVENVIAAGQLGWDSGLDVEGIQGRAHAALVEAHQAGDPMTAADNTDQAIADLRATLNDPTRTSQPSTADPRKSALHSVERTSSPLEYALDEVLTAVNDTDPVGAYDDYDDCSAEELLITRELGRIRQLITEIRVSHSLPVVTR